MRLPVLAEFARALFRLPPTLLQKLPGGMVVPLRAGNVPNIYWNATCTQQLRGEALYTALPPVADLPALDGVDTYRMVRQDSRLWDDLHQGVLTTGKLNASLGFYESRAAKRLGIPGSFVSHRPLLAAYHHLMDGTYTPTAACVAAAGRSQGASPTETGDAEARRKRCRTAASRGQQAVRMYWGTAQEGATLYALMHALPGSRLLEVGMFQLGPGQLPPAWGFRPGELPPLAASPDGMLWHPADLCSAADVRGAQREPEDGVGAAPPGLAVDRELRSLLGQLEAAQISDRRRFGQAGQPHPLSREGWAALGRSGRLEVVEVKNVSPFWARDDSSRFSISDRGPASQLLPFWVPQLQLEMLASGVASAILVSRSATKGMSLFRVPRDDAFLRQMLGQLRRFYATYVKRRQAPPRDMFFERNDYQALITRTLSIARNAQLLAHIPAPVVAPGADARAFID